MRPRPEPTYPITPEWQRRLAERLSDRGSRAALARQIGCSAPTITLLLSPEARHSHLVPKIHRALGWPPPEVPAASAEIPADPRAAELGRIYEQLTEEQRTLVLATARALAGKK